MAIRQITTPNVGIGASRGWCLKYVDDTTNAPARARTAEQAYQIEARNGNIRGGEPPVGVWVPLFFSLTRGQFAGLGHVALAFNHGDGRIEIHDSETQSGARGVYNSINELLAWFANLGIIYRGWSIWCDGTRYVEEYTPAPAQPQATGRVPASGPATGLGNARNLRAEPSTASEIVATYANGQQFNYDGYLIANGYVWLSYIGGSGHRRYVAEGVFDNDPNNVFVRGGVSR